MAIQREKPVELKGMDIQGNVVELKNRDGSPRAGVLLQVVPGDEREFNERMKETMEEGYKEFKPEIEAAQRLRLSA